VLIAGLSSGHKIGLLLVAALFVVFALASAFVIPRYRPDYPGRAGLPVFVAVTVALFLGMMAAVLVFGREAPEAEAGHGGATTAEGGPQSVHVIEVEYKIKVDRTSLSPGSYEFDLKNDGKIPHNLTIQGPGVSNAATPTIGGGKTAKLKAKLQSGEYDLYCSVPGHKQLGMDLKIKVP
jgi:uncharacterized cupredoxin-like copper-binding protein